MPTMMEFVPQSVKDFSQINRFTPIFSAIYKITLKILDKGYSFIRHHNPTINNVANAYEKSADISHIVKTAAIHNVVFYAVPVVGVKMLFAPARSYFPFSSSIFMLAEEGVMMALAVVMLASNVLYNLALTKAVVPHLPPQEVPICDCGAEQKISANVANLILYASLLAAASALNLVSSPLPETLAVLLQAMAYGYSLAGLQYSAYGVCATHFSEALNNHKVYYLSLGATVIYTVKQTSAKISGITGVAANFYLEDAIFSLVWQQAILLVVMQAKSPDYLNNLRLVMKDYMTTRFKNFLDNSPSDDKRDYVRKFNHLLISPLGNSLFSLKPVQLALSLHQAELMTALEWITWLNESNVTALATTIFDKLPFTTGQAKVLSTILKQQDWRQTADVFRSRLLQIELDREIGENVAHIEAVKELEVYEPAKSIVPAPCPSSVSNGLGFFESDGKVNLKVQPVSTVTVVQEEEDFEQIEAERDLRGHQTIHSKKNS